MTTALQAHISNDPNYLHLYWEHAPEATPTIEQLSKKDIIDSIASQQLQLFKQRQQTMVSKASGGRSFSTQEWKDIEQVLDASAYGDRLKEILEADLDSLSPELQSLQKELTGTDDLSMAIARLEALPVDECVNDLNRFTSQVIDLIQVKFAPRSNSTALRELGMRYLFELSLRANLNPEGVPWNQMTAEIRGKVAREAVQDLFRKSQYRIVPESEIQTDGSKLTNLAKSWLAAAVALPDLDTVGLGASPMNVAHSHGGDTKAGDLGEVLKQVKSKVLGGAKYSYRIGFEASSLIGLIEPVVKQLKPKLKELSIFANKRMTLKSGTGGTLTFTIDKNITDNETFMKVLDRAEVALKNALKQTSKADNYVKITANGVTINMGFSVKTGKDFVVNGVGGTPHIKLQDSTPLGTLLVREAGLSDRQYHNVLQFLVGIPVNDGGRDSQWQQVKQNLGYMSLTSAIAGSSLSEGFASYLITPIKIVSIRRILENIAQNANKNFSVTMTSQQGPGLQRSVYAKANAQASKQTNIPEERSSLIWDMASSLLMNTKIRINLNILDLAVFQGL